MRKLMRQMVISTLLLAVVGLAFASKGGGDKGKKAASLKTDFTPIRTTGNFTLKSTPAYSGSFFLGQEKTRTTISFNTLVTYEQGNSIFIMPYKYKVNVPGVTEGRKNNLQLLDLRINMHR